MAADSNLYAAEAVIGALARAGESALNALDEQQAVSHLLAAFRELLDVHSAVFYSPAPNGFTATLMESGPRLMKPPAEVTTELATYVRAAQRVVTSEDPVFQIGHLRMLPATSAASSVWSDVRRGDHEYGILAAFDASERSFRSVETQITRIIAQQLATAIELFRSRKAASQGHTQSTSAELNRYLEATQVVGSVARDLINPLTAMLGYIELMRGERLEETPRKYLEKLQLQAEKTQQMVMALNSSSHTAPALLRSKIAEQEEASAPAPFTAPPLSRARVLIVQKNEATLEFKKSVLANLHADLVTTFNGADAVQLLQNEDVHAVIVDDELEGEWPGRRLYGWICEHRPDLRDRVLLTVATQPKPEIKELIEESRLPFVSKPLQIVELYAGVQHILGRTDKKIVQ